MKKKQAASRESARLRKTGEELTRAGVHARKLIKSGRKPHKSEDRYRLLFEDDLTGDFIATPEGKIIDCNPSFVKIFGFSDKDEALNTNMADLYPKPGERETFLALLKSKKKLGYYEAIRRRRDGKLIHVVENVVGIFDKQSELVEIKGYLFDNSKQKKAEEEVRKEKELSDSLNRINAHIMSTLDFDEIMKMVVMEGSKSIGSETAAICILETGYWVLKYMHGFPSDWAGLRFDDKQLSHAELAKKTRDIVVINDARSDKRVAPDMVQKYRIRSVLVAPLMLREKVIGTFFFNYHSASHVFNNAQIDFARKLTAALSLSLENSDLFKKLKRSEKALRKYRDELEMQVQERTSEIKRANRALRMLYECNQIIVHATNEMDFLQDVCRTVVGTGGYRMSWVGYVEHDREKKVRPVAQAGYEDGYIETLNITWADSERGRGPTGRAARTGRPSIGRNFLTDPNFEPWRAEALKRGYASSICLPLIADSRTFGALTIYAVEPDAFDTEEVTLLKELADNIANCISALRLREEHRRADEILRKSKDEIEDLYNNAPCGYHSLDKDGTFVRINDTELLWMGYSRGEIIGKMKFTDILTPESLKNFNKNFPLFKSQGWIHDLEFDMLRKDGTILPVLLSASAIKDSSGNYVMSRSTVYDITERKDIETRTRITNILLELFARKTSRKEYVDAVVRGLQDWSGCRCVGVRIVNDQGYIPYESFVGFGEEFWRMENMLSLRKDACACIRAITGKFESVDLAAITPNGSFRLNDSIRFLNQLTEEEARKFRGNCMRCGFLSIAIIPIRYREQTLGAIHLADEKDGMVHSKVVQFIESMAPLIGEAIHRFNTEEELQEAYDKLEMRVHERTSELLKANEALEVEVKERMKAEDELKELTGELKRSNADLEQFAYAASHDLQEPLHVIRGFLKLFQKRYKDKIDEKAMEFIIFSIDSAKRMQDLIRGLLEYSRVGSKAQEFKPTDCSLMLAKTILNLKVAIEKSGAEVAYGSLPVIMADGIQLSSLFQNLVGNAIKFHGDEIPRVHISAERKGDEWLFSVRDNGIGIDPKFADRIFNVFQRLHTRDEYPGTGIGLAICKKIIEHHGGRIWLESEPGKGTAFYFTIPDRQTDTMDLQGGEGRCTSFRG